MTSPDDAHSYLTIATALGFSGSVAPDRLRPWLDPDFEPGVCLALSEGELRARGFGRAARERLSSGEAAENARRQLQALEEGPGTRLVWRSHPQWPASLAGLPGAPLVLWYRGRLEGLSGCLLAVVGTRHPTPYGIGATRSFVEGLGLAGLGIASGLARGIDALAHDAALRAGCPTFAVLGSGLDAIYPKENGTLAERIVDEGGCLLSEYPPDYGAHPGTFPRRNRIIAGVAQGVLVVEAGRRSGSLITADWANTYGRSVWAVPGPYHASSSRGCHDLIRDGALLAESPEGLLKDLGLAVSAVNGRETLGSALEASILAALRRGPQPIDALVTELDGDLEKVLLGLQRLEANDLVECRAGGIYYLR